MLRTTRRHHGSAQARRQTAACGRGRERHNGSDLARSAAGRGAPTLYEGRGGRGSRSRAALAGKKHRSPPPGLATLEVAAAASSVGRLPWCSSLSRLSFDCSPSTAASGPPWRGGEGEPVPLVGARPARGSAVAHQQQQLGGPARGPPSRGGARRPPLRGGPPAPDAPLLHRSQLPSGARRRSREREDGEGGSDRCWGGAQRERYEGKRKGRRGEEKRERKKEKEKEKNKKKKEKEY
ncbi:hypothetical protein C2845_PM11G29120 [Panicum miliaceum]|uniref:Uncharacterized protein n=1 Tax=Panicum miliaceum TaxID=4540 RepID=A0A3L6RMZ6_PANMI|nr:hypothetical protein C2845_PM11G29120 [Panicum miliaceum]